MPTPKLTRRSLIGSMIALIAAPAVVRCESLMALRGVPPAVALMATDWPVDDLMVRATERYAYGWIDVRYLMQTDQEWEPCPPGVD